MKPTTSRSYIVNQIATVLLVALSFFLISRVTGKMLSFLVGMLVYWAILIVQLLILDKDISLKAKLLDTLVKSHKLWLSLLCFIPSALVFFVAFLPLMASVNCWLLLLTGFIGLVNGFLEEAYWRGRIYKTPGIWFAIVSTLLFAGNHASFLFFDLTYQGGAPNLIGGPLIMGALWLAVAQKTGTIKYGIVAHQIVNALAFYSLLVANS